MITLTLRWESGTSYKYSIFLTIKNSGSNNTLSPSSSFPHVHIVLQRLLTCASTPFRLLSTSSSLTFYLDPTISRYVDHNREQGTVPCCTFLLYQSRFLVFLDLDCPAYDLNEPAVCCVVTACRCNGLLLLPYPHGLNDLLLLSSIILQDSIPISAT
jgi:hypothetical protein